MNPLKNMGGITKAKDALSKEAYKKSKEYLTMLNGEINGFKQQGQNLKEQFGAPFRKDKKAVTDQKTVVKALAEKYKQPNDIIRCAFGLTINNKQMGGEMLSQVTDISVDLEVGVPDSITITIKDIEGRFIEDDIIVKEAPLICSVVLHDTEECVYYFSGFISAIDIKFTESFEPVMELHCMDETHRANKEKKKRSWSNKTSAQVVQEICKEYGWQCYVEPSYPFPVQSSITQNNKTDLEFLKELAGDELDLFVANLVTEKDGKSTMYYVIEGFIDKKNAVQLEYGETPYDIISFSPQLNKESRQSKSESSNVNKATKGTETATISNSASTEDSSASETTTSTETSNEVEEGEVIYTGDGTFSS
jgi:hypothetical protein